MQTLGSSQPQSRNSGTALELDPQALQQALNTVISNRPTFDDEGNLMSGIVDSEASPAEQRQTDQPEPGSRRPEDAGINVLQEGATTRGRFLSDTVKEDVLRRIKLGETPKKIAEHLKVSRPAVNRLVAASRTKPMVAGMKTAKGLISEWGKRQIMNRIANGEKISHIARQLGLSDATVRGVNRRAARAEQAPEGMKTPKGRHLSEKGRQEVVRRRNLVPPESYHTISNALGVSEYGIRKLAKIT
jgi:DNA-binding NarL/FixJ family response regulator